MVAILSLVLIHALKNAYEVYASFGLMTYDLILAYFPSLWAKNSFSKCAVQPGILTQERKLGSLSSESNPYFRICVRMIH